MINPGVEFPARTSRAEYKAASVVEDGIGIPVGRYLIYSTSHSIALFQFLCLRGTTLLESERHNLMQKLPSYLPIGAACLMPDALR